MTVAELIARLQQPDVGQDWPIVLNTYGENLDIGEVQVDETGEAVVLTEE